MNARNHVYISKYNSRASKRFADDKLYTKNFLESRGIGVAKLYRAIDSYEDLRQLEPKDFPHSFVIKPNHGFGGEGILVIRGKKGDTFVTVSGRRISFEELFLHCSAILDGKFSISGLSDKVIVEERLDPHEDFSQVVSIGLPDIRLIVFNMVPVIAMLRVPTPESEGKANVHLGGIAAGIDIATGRTTHGVQYNKPVRKFANGRGVRNFRVPFWDEILLSAAKIQASTKIGFLAIDFVITDTGVKVLEMNARAGLMIQIANRVMLKARLEKVSDLKVPSPEKGVEVAKTLFSPKTVQTEKEEKPIIGTFENVIFLGKRNEQIMAKIDLHGQENFVEERLLDSNELISDVLVRGKRLKLPFAGKDFSEQQHQMVLCAKYLKDFLIDPAQKSPAPKSKIVRHGQEKILKNIDRKMCELDRQIKLLSHFKPQNLEEAKATFLANPVTSPQFFYKSPSFSCVEFRKKLQKIPRQCDHPLMPLFVQKIEEMELKTHLIESIDAPELQKFSEQIWGTVDERIYKQAVDFLKNTPMEPDTSKKLSFSDIIDRIEAFLHDHKLKHWKVKVLESTVADFQISKQNMVFVRKNVRVTENRLLSLLAHEIETHVYRLENGRKAPFEIFERGTAGYLKTEEGLASYNQMRVGVPLGEKVFFGAHRIVAAYMGKRMSFVDLFHYMKNTFDLSDESAWRACIKTKRGLSDTSKRLSFVKDMIYFSGMKEVEAFLKKNPDGMKQLYLGKITIEDLKILHQWEEEKWNVRFLPTLTVEEIQKES